jgi:hypothetical protein
MHQAAALRIEFVAAVHDAADHVPKWLALLIYSHIVMDLLKTAGGGPLRHDFVVRFERF